MTDQRERRKADAELVNPAGLRAGLNRAQRDALATLEQLGWDLRFVRRPMFLDPIPVVFQRDGERFVVIESDGSLNENPGFRIRR
ncbi:hypothetical protein ACI2IY_13605 [Lysobacter enzymogenes]|uniref:hypothetical protein n=1 Tax=Lysobacter enzymogenes TaxID=69 RepID=UPI00384CF8F8